MHNTPSSLALAITDHPLFYKVDLKHINDQNRVKREPFDKKFFSKDTPFFLLSKKHSLV